MAYPLHGTLGMGRHSIMLRVAPEGNIWLNVGLKKLGEMRPVPAGGL